MGMDVFGKRATAPEGEYFRRNVWGWRPLVEMCQKLAPKHTAACECWDTNDGGGLSAKGAESLASELQKLVADGTVAHYISARNVWLVGLPDEPCMACKVPLLMLGSVAMFKGDECPACNGRGKRTAWARNYHLNEDDVEEWIAFLKACGGFGIY